MNSMGICRYNRHGLMLNACQVKLNIGIELYRCSFIYAQVFRIREGRQDREAQSHRASCSV